ncbi:MAG: transglycosylase SLT domain-containing protein [Bacteroidota bacterium]
MNRFLIPALLFLAFLAGCTPTSENIAKKADLQDVGDSISEDALADPADQVPLLDPASNRIIRRYGATIKRYSELYGFDWRLVLAVMKQESRFSHRAESRMGASGLMQIMPVTGEEVARKLDLNDLSHPENNIRGGIYYLRTLFEMFQGTGEADRVKLTLAAYNAGATRIYDAQEIAAYFHEDPSTWKCVRDALPLLSRRYSPLHRSIWEQDRPRGGWFGNARETLRYVDAVMDYYDEYRLVLN